MQFGLLGEVMVWGPDGVIDVGHARQRSVLAALLVDANRVVTVDQLFERVWGGLPPQTARSTLFTYLTRLRQALAPVPIERKPGGYQITVEPEALDLHQFSDLLAKARDNDDDQAAAQFYQQALRLWRGEPLLGVDTPWADDVRGLLNRRRFAAELDYADVQLRLGQHTDLLPELASRAAAHSLDERLAGQLILALYRSGRMADALEHYHEFRRRLADQLGADPGPSLRDLHRQILESGQGSPAPTRERDRAPRQLPPAVTSFTGRKAELAALDAHLLRPGAPGGVCAIVGGGGIGKSALAVHWAQQNADRFPDGQLFVNLRGFDPSGRPTEPSTVLRGFLRALGATGPDIPADLDGQVDLYRSLVADRRMLVLLDNAAGTAQVEPLLAGSPTVSTLVTSRHPLTGLVAVHGAHMVLVDVFSDAEAYDMLISRLGEARLAAEPDAVSALVRHCAGLPLALAIVAARASAKPGLPLAVLAAQLRDDATRLDGLDAGEASVGLRAVLALSHQVLAPKTARLACLVGLAPGPDISLAAADVLADGHAERMLSELESMHLIAQPSPGRYRMHDLVRLDAVERASLLPVDVRVDALRRLVTFYLRTAHTADRLLDPRRPPVELSDSGPGPRPLPLTGKDEAVHWLSTEHPCLLAAQQLAAEHGWHAQVWELALVTDTLHWRQGRLTHHLAVSSIAIHAAQIAGDLAVLCRLHQNIGKVLARAGRSAESMSHIERSIELAARIHDPTSEGHGHMTLTQVWGQQGDLQRAFDHAELALRLYRAGEQRVFEAQALNQLGYVAALLGRFDEARTHCEAALDLQAAVGEPNGDILDSLGYIHQHSGRLARAAEYYRQAVTAFGQAGDTYNAATTLIQLGQVHASLGSLREAESAWQRALELCQVQQRTADAKSLRKQLADLSARGSRRATC